MLTVITTTIGLAVLGGVFGKLAERTTGHVWDKLAQRRKKDG
ncbi:hypothetical protein ACFC36_19710 [Streptomyces rubiginosohelvolus]